MTEWASAVLGDPTPEDTFAYVCAVLGAPAYVVEFEERGLIAERPRVPLTLDGELAREVVRLGTELIELWTLGRAPVSDVRWASGHTANELWVAEHDPSAETITVAGRTLEGVPSAVWDYEVSGLRVLPRYLEDRQHHTPDAALLEELRRVVSAIRGLLEHEPELDALLKRVLASNLASV